MSRRHIRSSVSRFMFQKIYGLCLRGITELILKDLLCVAYIIPYVQVRIMSLYIISYALDVIRSTYSNVGIVIMEDCNSFNEDSIRHTHLRLIVTQKTYMGSILDVFLTHDVCHNMDNELNPPIVVLPEIWKYK